MKEINATTEWKQLYTLLVVEIENSIELNKKKKKKLLIRQTRKRMKWNKWNMNRMKKVINNIKFK